MAYCALCGFFGNFPVTSTPSMGISAPGGNSSRSLRAASTIADPQQVIPLDPPAPEAHGRSVSPMLNCTSSRSTPKASAAIWVSAVQVPVPMSAAPINTR